MCIRDRRSVADAVPRAALICAVVGLHPGGKGVCVMVITGAVRSEVQLTVLVSVAILPQASVAVNVLVWDLAHPVEITAPSLGTSVGVPQRSVADAVPRAALICAVVGLHPGGKGVCVMVITGAVRSEVQLTVLVSVAILPQASVAVNVLVWDLAHPVEITAPSLGTRVGVPQRSVADAVPRAALICAVVGLHPGGKGVCVMVITGAVISSVQLTVLVSVAILPQPSVAVNVLVCDLEHPVEILS